MKKKANWEIVAETLVKRRQPACKGDPENPVTEGELAAKALSLCESGGVDRASAQSLFKAIGKLVEDGPLRALSLLDYVKPGKHHALAAKRA